MFLRLDVTLLTACLRGQQPESESVTALPPIYVDRSIAGDHEVFEDPDQELQDLVVYWKCNGLLLLVVLALSRPEKTL